MGVSRNGDNGFDSDPYPLQHIHASHGGGVAHVDNRNQISTTAIVICTGLVLLAIAIVGAGEIHVSGIAASAVGIANQAEREAQNAEREARLSMDKEEIDASNIAVNKALIESYGIAKIVQQEKAK